MNKCLLVVLSLLVGCSSVKKSSTESTPALTSAGTPIAKFNGQVITDEDIRAIAGSDLVQAEIQLYEARRDGIDQYIDDKLLETEAQQRGVAKEALLEKEVNSKVIVKEGEIQKFYNEKKTQMGGKKLDEVKANIEGYLKREKQGKLYAEFQKKLRKKAEIEILIQAPKLEVVEGEAPGIGPKDAPIRLVEFTDYQCPFCSRARPTINQVLKEYKGKVRYVLKDFPLSFHRDAVKAHEAAHCAGDQGKYWEMNQKIWDNQKQIGVDDLKKYAEGFKLNMKNFNDCLDSGKFNQLVMQNQQEGEKVGVSGTPAFFINGRMISGARPFESFKEIIDDELARN